MRPAVPLRPKQIAAAAALHERLDGWRRSDRALDALRQSLPDFGPEPTLLKAVVVNSLYGTNVFAIVRVAEHVQRVLTRTHLASAGPDLVERLADVPMGGSEKKPKRRYSFAAKFAHFFIDPERFPIFDSYADRMLRLHLGEAITSIDAVPYVAFADRFDRIWAATGLVGDRRQLDRYLWIAGQYLAWRRNPAVLINTESRGLFEGSAPELAALVPAS